MSYGNAIPVRLKDSSDVTQGLQKFSDSDEKYLAYKIGHAQLQSDSDAHGALGIFQYDNTALFVGAINNTYFDSAVGTGGDARLSIVTDTTTLYRTNRQSTVDLLNNVGSNNYVHPVSVDSDGKGRMVIAEMSGDQYNSLIDRLNGDIIDNQYPGAYILGVSSASGGSQSGYTEVLPDFYSDEISVTDSSSTARDTTGYSIWQRTSFSGDIPPVRRPFMFKRGDSDERPVPNVRFSMDSTASHDSAGADVFNFQRNDLLLRPVAGFLSYVSDSAGANSLFSLAPDKKTLTRLFGQHRNDSAGVATMTPFKTNYLRTDNSTLTNGKLSGEIQYFSGRSDSDATGYSENKLRGVKIKTKRFSNVASYGGVTDAVRNDSTVQNLKDSNGYHTFEILFDENTKFTQRSYDSANHGNAMGSGFYQSEESGAWETRFPVEGSNYLRVESGDTVLSSSTRTLVDAIKSANSGSLPDALGFNLRNTSNSMGALDSDEISLLVYRDFKGLQEMDSATIVGALGGRGRLRTQFPDRVGNYVLLSSAQGQPTDVGYTGTWVAKGTATDTRRVLFDQNYLRTRTSTFLGNYAGEYVGDYGGVRTSNFNRLRQSNYTRDFQRTAVITRSSSYSAGFVGNYTGDFTRNSTADFSRAFTRQSTYTRTSQRDSVLSFQRTGEYVGEFLGNYTNTFTAYTRTSGTFTGNFAGAPGFTSAEIYNAEVGAEYYWVETDNEPFPDSFEIWWNSTQVGLGIQTGSITEFQGNDGNLYIRGSYQGAGAGTSIFRVRRIRRGTTNFTRNSTRTSTDIELYTRTSQLSFIGNYARLLSFTGTFTGDFTGNYTRDFTRVGAGSFTRDFAGDFTGDYTRTRTSTYSRSCIGQTASYTRTDDYTRTRSSNYTRDRIQTRTTNSREANFLRGDGTGYGTVAYTGPGLPGANADGQNYSSLDAYGEVVANYAGYPSFQGNFNRTFTGDYARNFLGNYTRTVTRNSNFTGDVNFTRDFTGNYTRESNRTRTSTYLATEGFSRDFIGNFLGDYTGDFTRNFEGDYARDFGGEFTRTSTRDSVGDYNRGFLGNYAGGTIGTASEIIETYTLYARRA